MYVRMLHYTVYVFLSRNATSHPEAPNSTAAKGPVLHTAVIAGTQGAKKTSDLLPFCHPVQLDHCKVMWAYVCHLVFV